MIPNRHQRQRDPELPSYIVGIVAIVAFSAAVVLVGLQIFAWLG